MSVFTAGNLIRNGTWLTQTDGNVAAPGISFFSERTSGFSRLASNVDVSVQGLKMSTVYADGLVCTGNVNVSQYLIGNGAGITPPVMTISNILVANSSYTVLDDTAVDTAGGYIVINGTNFGPGTMVSIGSNLATSVTFVSTTQLRAQIPASSSGSYTVQATRADGTIATVPVGISYSPFPVWSTSATLANVTKTIAFTQTLAATEATGANVVYAVSSGSSLPANVSLAGNGVLSGNIVNDPGNATTYSFTIDAIDTQFQNIPRTFSLNALRIYPITYLIVAGGGGGGSAGGGYNRGAGGGGAGGYLTGTFTLYSGIAYTVTIGAGGNGAGNGSRANGTKGSNSVFNTLTAEGGGYGSSPYNSVLGDNPGGSGGSGGGAGDMGGIGGTGSQGYGGGSSSVTTSAGGGGAAGGGAGSIGQSSLGDGNSGSAAGGTGLSNSITGAAVTYAVGGNGGIRQLTTSGASASVNTGSGGGGGNGNSGGITAGGAGGSGIVIIAYPDTYPALSGTTGTVAYSTPTRTGYRVYRFTSGTGTMTLTA